MRRCKPSGPILSPPPALVNVAVQRGRSIESPRVALPPTAPQSPWPGRRQGDAEAIGSRVEGATGVSSTAGAAACSAESGGGANFGIIEKIVGADHQDDQADGQNGSLIHVLLDRTGQRTGSYPPGWKG